MYRKMSLVPTHDGYRYECFYCEVRCTPEEADNHECIPRHAGHDARVDDYTDKQLIECLTCSVIFTAPKEG